MSAKVYRNSRNLVSDVHPAMETDVDEEYEMLRKTVFENKTKTKEEQAANKEQEQSTSNTYLIIIFALIVVVLIALIVWIVVKQDDSKKIEEDAMRARIRPHPRNDLPSYQPGDGARHVAQNRQYYPNQLNQLPNSSTPNQLPNSSTPNQLPNSSTPNQLPNSSTTNQLPNSSTPNQLPNSSTPNQLPNSSTPNQLTQRTKSTKGSEEIDSLLQKTAEKLTNTPLETLTEEDKELIATVQDGILEESESESEQTETCMV